MNLKVKRIFALIFMIMILISNFNFVQATSISDIEESANTFIEKGKEKYNEQSGISNDITTEVRPVVKLLAGIGILVIACCIVVLGIQWVMSKPSPEAQAKLKHRFVALAVAAGVLFGSYTIWSIIVTIMDSIGG